MTLETNDMIYLVTNVFYAYILCKFMRAFFGQKGRNLKLELLSFAAYYCVNSAIYLGFRDTVVTISSNLLCYFLLTLNYQARVRSRVASVIFIYAILASSETIMLLLLQLLGMNHFTEFSTLEFLTAQILVEIICYTIVLLFSNYKMHKRDYPMPLLYWIAIIAIPVGTLLPSFMITETITPDKIGIMVVSEILILLINFFVFYLYDYIAELYTELMEKRLLEQQALAYQKELEIITHSQQNLRIFRHDMRHHLGVLRAFIQRNEHEAALAYLDDIGAYLSTKQEVARTGNLAVDSIVNYMAGVAQQKGIILQCNMQIPESLSIAAFDLNGILSNLLDNALKVTALLSDDNSKTVTLTMHYERKVLYLAVENPCTVKAQKEASASGHGLGLKSVQMAAEKYGGTVQITESPEIFRVEVLLYEP